MSKIILYSTGCPKCTVLKKKFEQSGLEYTLVENAEETVKVGLEHNLKSAPFAIIDDEIYDFNAALNWLKGV